MRNSYPSDITRNQFSIIEPLLLKARKRTRPRTLDLYDVFCAVLYVLKSGCQWRMLPKDFPKWYSVYPYFQIWSKQVNGSKSVLEKALQEIGQKYRIDQGRNPETSFCIIDSQSVKNTDTAENKGYDAGKKVSGIKRHIAVDSEGIPHGIHITTANISDRDGAIEMLVGNKSRFNNVENVAVDGGYVGGKFASEVKEIINAKVEVVKRNEWGKFVLLPKRWIVERSFSWLEKWRRLWKNCERKLNTSMHMVVTVFLTLLLKRL